MKNKEGKKYRIILKECFGSENGCIDFDKILYDLFVEVDGQIYRTIKHEIKQENKKFIMGEMFEEIGRLLKIENKLINKEDSL